MLVDDYDCSCICAQRNSKLLLSPTVQEKLTALQSRYFATWTVTAGVVRLYASYNISNPGGFFGLDDHPIQP
ncbi:hypothetical protein PSTT_13765 [Puccinia striiformis]|nr:hypothetical protein PSTT_13765 [Puccinia striiformis]